MSESDVTATIRANYKPTMNDVLTLIFRDGIAYTLLPMLLYIATFGWLIVALALCFRREQIEGENPASQGIQFVGWKDIALPKWAYILSNDEVGAMGDYLWPERIPKVLEILGVKTPEHPVAMWWWLAIRNPINNLQQRIGQTMEHSAVIDYCGDLIVDSSAEIKAAGSHFVKCSSGGKTTFSYFFVYQYPWVPAKCLRIRWGYKVKPDVDIEKKIVLKDKIGTVTVIAPWKTFGEGD